jgi:hypothetical protein
MIKRMTLALAALLFGASMHTEAFAQTSQIREMTGNWTGDDPRLLKPRLLQMVASTGLSVDRVDATFARHLWPGGDLAHRIAAVFDRASGEWRTNPVARTARRGDSLFIQWEIFYRRLAIKQPQKTRVSGSPLRERTIGCTQADSDRDLLLLRTMAQGLLVGYPEVVLPLSGYPAPPHLMVSLRNMGFKMVKGEVAIGANSMRLGPSDLAMYAPRQQRPVNELRCQYLPQLMDSIPDGYYRLARWAYAETQRDVRRRPSLRCVPHKALVFT